MTECEYYLWLLSVMGTANPRSLRLIEHFGSPREVYRAIMVENQRSFLKEREKSNLPTATPEKMREISAYCARHSVKIITLSDKAYPLRLKNVFNPPILLFTVGDISRLDETVALTVIGTRAPTARSVKLGTRIAGELAHLGMAIISGMALGCDSIAHAAALEAGTITVGVLAGGIDVDYPKGSGEMKRAIVKSGGAILTELLPGTHVDPKYFSARNRILSGLSLGTFIIEASPDSGCILTANHAVSQSRDLFFLAPEDGYAECYRGALPFLRDGATAVYDYTDIAREYLFMFDEERQERILADTEKIGSFGIKPLNVRMGKKRHSAEPDEQVKPNAEGTKPPPLSDDLDPAHRAVAELLFGGAMPFDELLEKSALGSGTLSELLLDLEIEGVIESCPPASYRLTES